jgi:opacity protein-like surface antigen
MNFKLLAGAALAAGLAAAGASAQGAGWTFDPGYRGADGLNSNSSDEAADGKAREWRWSTDNSQDWTGFARVGYHFDPHWRIELEGGFRNGLAGEANAQGAPMFEPIGPCGQGQAAACGRPSGAVDSYTIMGNVIYDVLPDNRWFEPFVGAGGGFGAVPGGSTPYAQFLSGGGANAVFAAQAMAGVGVQLTRRLNLGVTYRYLWSNDLAWSALGPLAGFYSPGRFHGQPNDQSVLIGLRYWLSQPGQPASATPIHPAP